MEELKFSVTKNGKNLSKKLYSLDEETRTFSTLEDDLVLDNILSEVINHKGNVYKVKNYGKDKISYIVQDDDIYSHGATIKEARDSLIYKISNRDTSIYNDVQLDDEFDLKDIIKMYRVITGACELGTRYFVENNNLPDKLTVQQTIDLTQGQYGNEQFKKFFEEKR